MIATIEFDLPEDDPELRAALAGKDALIAIEKIDQWARGLVKYGEINNETRDTLEHLREYLIPQEMLEILQRKQECTPSGRLINRPHRN